MRFKPVVDYAHEQGPQQCSADAADAAGKARAADHSRGNRVDLVGDCRIRLATSVIRGEHDPGKVAIAPLNV